MLRGAYHLLDAVLHPLLCSTHSTVTTKQPAVPGSQGRTQQVSAAAVGLHSPRLTTCALRHCCSVQQQLALLMTNAHK